jgi:LuxR family maltose regulon positive regulatory protein
MGGIHPPDALLSWRLFVGRAGHGIPLEVKLRPPVPRRQWLPRGGLLDDLAAFPARLVVLAAPTGFGKTIVAAQWLARQAGDRPGAWVSLDRGDNDPVRLWWHVVCALKQALPDLDDSQELRPPSSPGPDLDGQLLPALVRELAGLATPVVLVLDDYHLIRNPRCHEQMAFVLARLPPCVQVVLITRAGPPLPLARLRETGEMREIRARDLRFTAADAAGAFRVAGGAGLTHDEAATLTRWVDGWPAAVCLAAVALRGTAAPAAVIGQLARGGRHCADALTEEFLTRQEPEVQRFLQRTSVLEHFTAPLCDVVAGLTGSAGIIAGLERDTPFLVPLDAERQWHAYHPLFASLMRSRLAAAGPAAAAALHQRASRWHADQGSPRAAIGHAMAARDAEAVVALIARFWGVLARVGRIATVRAWLGSLGDERIGADPVAAHCAAWAAAIAGDITSARRWLTRMEAARYGGPLPDGMRSLEFSAALLRALYGFDGLRVMRRSAAAAARLDDDPQSPWYAQARSALGISL